MQESTCHVGITTPCRARQTHGTTMRIESAANGSVLDFSSSTALTSPFLKCRANTRQGIGSRQSRLVAGEVLQKAARDDHLGARLRVVLGRHALDQLRKIVLYLRAPEAAWAVLHLVVSVT